MHKSSGSAVGDINIHHGDQATIQGVKGQTKINNLYVLDGYISIQGCKMTEHDEYLLDLDQVAGCCQPSNLSSDFPLGSRKFRSYY